MNALATAAVGIGAFLSGILGGFHHGSTTLDIHPRVAATGSGSADLACIAAAVAAREGSLDTAVAGKMTAINAAYGARAGALATAYASSDPATVKAGEKAAWNAFAASVGAAQKTWKAAQESAWTQFRAALKACGVGASAVSDSVNASLDTTGGN